MSKPTVVIVLLLAWMGLPAPGAGAEPLQEADRLINDMRYTKALKLAAQVLRSSQSGPEELVEAYRVQGACLAGMGKSEQAVESFRRLLAIKPDYRIADEASPRVKAPFFKALSMRGMSAIAIRHRVPKPPKRLRGLKLHLAIDSNPFGMIHAVRLRFRSGEGEPWRSVKTLVKKRARVACKLPKQIRASSIGYYFEALNQRGGVLARAGAADQPFLLEAAGAGEPVAVAAKEGKPGESSAGADQAGNKESASTAAEAPEEKPESVVRVAKKRPPAGEPTSSQGAGPPPPMPPPDTTREEPEEDDPWYTTWWFWTAVGVAVAGIATGAAVALASDGSEGPAGYIIYLK